MRIEGEKLAFYLGAQERRRRRGLRGRWAMRGLIKAGTRTLLVLLGAFTCSDARLYSGQRS